VRIIDASDYSLPDDALGTEIAQRLEDAFDAGYMLVHVDENAVIYVLRKDVTKAKGGK
jgi:hypothetical protein